MYLIILPIALSKSQNNNDKMNEKASKVVLYQLKVCLFYSEVMEASYIAKIRLCRYLADFGYYFFILSFHFYYIVG